MAISQIKSKREAKAKYLANARHRMPMLACLNYKFYSVHCA
jgi:hypothetical protein